MINIKNYYVNLPNGETLFGPINIEVLAGEVLIIKGRNGCGKSTFLQRIVQNGVKDGLVSVASNQISYLPQRYNLDFDFPFTLNDALQTEKSLSGDVGISKYKLAESINLKRLWSTASGGEKKKILLMRCLKSQSKILILDEPLNHLDQNSRNLLLMDLNIYMNENHDSCLVLVTHDELSDWFKDKKLKYLELG